MRGLDLDLELDPLPDNLFVMARVPRINSSDNTALDFTSSKFLISFFATSIRV